MSCHLRLWSLTNKSSCSFSPVYPSTWHTHSSQDWKAPYFPPVFGSQDCDLPDSIRVTLPWLASTNLYKKLHWADFHKGLNQIKIYMHAKAFFEFYKTMGRDHTPSYDKLHHTHAFPVSDFLRKGHP